MWGLLRGGTPSSSAVAADCKISPKLQPQLPSTSTRTRSGRTTRTTSSRISQLLKLEVTKMSWVLLCVWWTFLLAASVDCMSLPPIHWNQSNPMFKASNNDHIIEVKINDDIDFVCPYVTEEEIERSPTEVYIIYQVTQDEYVNCVLHPGRRKNLVVNCSQPRRSKRFTIIFERYSSIPNGQEYRSGEKYYFITTSTGSEEGLTNSHRGACHSDNMKLTIQVCCQQTTTNAPQLPSNGSSSTAAYTPPGPLLPIHTTPHSTRPTPTATTTLPTTTTTTLSTTTARRTTPSTRARWKYPTTDKFPSTKHDNTNKKDEENNDYHHENEVLPNKEQLVNTAAASLLLRPSSLLLLASSALIARLLSVVISR